MLNRNEPIPHAELCGIDWLKRKSWPSHISLEQNPLSIVSLFCGCGGMTLGVWEATRIHKRNLEIRLAVDASNDALEVYKTNFNLNNSTVIGDDVCNLFPGEFGEKVKQVERKLKKQVSKIDLIIAGPPCQGHSDLNNRSRRNDPRNNLFLKVVRATELFKPNAVLIENVPTIVHDKSRVVEKASEQLIKLGYSLSSTLLNGTNVGLPQRRKRFFLSATKKMQFDFDKCLKINSEVKVTLKDFIFDLKNEPLKKIGIFFTPSDMTQTNKDRVDYLFNHDMYDLPNELRPSCHRDKPHSYVSMYGRLHWDEPAQTITSGFGSMGQGRYVHPASKRTITPHEAARIQGFPDFYQFNSVSKRTALQKMIGNAVPPRLSALIVHEMLINKIF